MVLCVTLASQPPASELGITPAYQPWRRRPLYPYVVCAGGCCSSFKVRQKKELTRARAHNLSRDLRDLLPMGCWPAVELPSLDKGLGSLETCEVTEPSLLHTLWVSARTL